jgi:uncharacterized protein YaeQ
VALKATIFKAVLQIADMDRNYYQDHALTIARHPSETDERMMARVLAFAMHASDSLTFGKGLSTEDEPDLWQKDLTDAIQTWIDVGQPDERRIRRACGRADRVFVYSFGANAASAWWEQAKGTLSRMQNLTVNRLSTASTRELALLAHRNMHLSCTIQEGQVWMSDEKQAVMLQPECVQAPAPV